jgi:hypothetical protein
LFVCYRFDMQFHPSEYRFLLLLVIVCRTCSEIRSCVYYDTLHLTFARLQAYDSSNNKNVQWTFLGLRKTTPSDGPNIAMPRTIMILINVACAYLLNPMPLNEIDFYYAWLCVPGSGWGVN